MKKQQRQQRVSDASEGHNCHGLVSEGHNVVRTPYYRTTCRPRRPPRDMCRKETQYRTVGMDERLDVDVRMDNG